MGVKKFSKEKLFELFNIKLTDEQIKNSEIDEIEIEYDDMSFDEVKKKYKKELDAIKEETIKKRFKIKDEKNNPKDLEQKFDIETFKKEIRENAVAEATKAVVISNFIDKLDDNDKDDARAIINAKIKKGIKLNEAIDQAKKRFVDIPKKQNLEGFGQPSSNTGAPKDEVADIMAEYENKI